MEKIMWKKFMCFSMALTTGIRLIIYYADWWTLKYVKCKVNVNEKLINRELGHLIKDPVSFRNALYSKTTGTLEIVCFHYLNTSEYTLNISVGFINF